jgi:hypothetical protein
MVSMLTVDYRPFVEAFKRGDVNGMLKLFSLADEERNTLVTKFGKEFVASEARQEGALLEDYLLEVLQVEYNRRNNYFYEQGEACLKSKVEKGRGKSVEAILVAKKVADFLWRCGEECLSIAARNRHALLIGTFLNHLNIAQKSIVVLWYSKALHAAVANFDSKTMQALLENIKFHRRKIYDWYITGQYNGEVFIGNTNLQREPY